MGDSLAIKDWWHFQHYHDRSPPWIKTYRALLADRAFIGLPDAAQGQLVKLWIVGADFDGVLPNDPLMLRGLIRTKGKDRLYLPEITKAGFLVECDASDASRIASIHNRDGASSPASTSASASRAGARAGGETEREGETESERETTTTNQSSARDRLLALVPDRRAWEDEIASSIEGRRGVLASAVQIELACRDYLGNGAATTPNLQQFRGYIRRAVQPTRASRGSPGAQQYANAGGRR